MMDCIKNIRGVLSQPLWFLFFLSLACPTQCSDTGYADPAYRDDLVYADSLSPGWQNWSWNTTVDFSASNPVYSGSHSLSVQYLSAWAGLFLHASEAIHGADYESLRFWIHGGSSGGQDIILVLYDEGGAPGPGVQINPSAGSWEQVEVTLDELGSPFQITGIVFQDATGSVQPVYYLDDISLISASGTPVPTPTAGPGPGISIDAGSVLHPISPFIYGMSFADEELAEELALPVRRFGGNSTTRYSYLFDTSNRASDWYFENIPEDNAHPEQLPDGSVTDRFIEQDMSTGTKTLLTVPLIGWAPKSREWNWGYSVAKYGSQQSVDPYRPDAGNGVLINGTEITWNDPEDTSTAIGPDFVTGWINHLIDKYGTAAEGGVLFYNLDNEPMLWNETHRDVYPGPLSYDEIRDRTYAYGHAVKTADPSALTLGPVVWGWTAYFYSALDWEPGGAWWQNPQDRNAHGGMPFIEWYLDQMHQYELLHGERILDYVDVHCYPQQAGVALGSAGGPETQALRLRSTRQLWDPAYLDESWIGEPVRLIPRMKSWVQDRYPGTLTAITEYNWGGHEHINGALAQADLLGIFGREGLDLACLWGPPDEAQPCAYAFRIYRNYDSAGGQFGDSAVSTASSDQSELSAYAARRTSDGALTVVVINKTASPLTAPVSLSGFQAGGNAEVYRYSESNLNAIIHEADQVVGPVGFTAGFPPNSITLFVLHPDLEPVPVTGYGTAALLLLAAGVWLKTPVRRTSAARRHPGVPPRSCRRFRPLARMPESKHS